MRGAGGSTAARESSVSAVAERAADERVVDEHRRYVPGEPLRRYVAGYTGYRQRGLPPARHRGLPSPYLTLIFTLDEPLTIEAHPDRGQPPGEFGTLLGGLHSVPALDPGALGPDAASPEVSWAWQRLLREGGALRVSELAAGTGWSGRHLTSRFRAEIGLTPKAAARVIRFDRARKLLVRNLAGATADAGHRLAHDRLAHYRLADLAADCGYFDQAHLAREFRALAGCPPSQWLAEEFRNVQAGNWVTGEGWELTSAPVNRPGPINPRGGT
jgi:AraC-like DNA-binding protein